MNHPLLLQNMTQPEAAAALAKGTAIVVTGSVEQHGGHLPLGTDYFAALTVALRVAERLGPDRTVVTIAVDSGMKYLSTALYGRA